MGASRGLVDIALPTPQVQGPGGRPDFFPERTSHLLAAAGKCFVVVVGQVENIMFVSGQGSGWSGVGSDQTGRS